MFICELDSSSQPSPSPFPMPFSSSASITSSSNASQKYHSLSTSTTPTHKLSQVFQFPAGSASPESALLTGRFSPHLGGWMRLRPQMAGRSPLPPATPETFETTHLTSQNSYGSGLSATSGYATTNSACTPDYHSTHLTHYMYNDPNAQAQNAQCAQSAQNAQSAHSAHGFECVNAADKSFQIMPYSKNSCEFADPCNLVSSVENSLVISSISVPEQGAMSAGIVQVIRRQRKATLPESIENKDSCVGPETTLHFYTDRAIQCASGASTASTIVQSDSNTPTASARNSDQVALSVAASVGVGGGGVDVAARVDVGVGGQVPSDADTSFEENEVAQSM